MTLTYVGSQISDTTHTKRPSLVRQRQLGQKITGVIFPLTRIFEKSRIMKTIFTVACEIPGGYGEYVDFNSKTSLLDAGFVVFRPRLIYNNSMDPNNDYDRIFSPYFDSSNRTRTYQGKPSLPDDSSFQLKEAITHWRRELTDFIKAGRTVFTIMSSREQVYVNTGEKEHSGTGRNRQTTEIVSPISNYDLLPLSEEIVESKGTSMILNPSEPLLKEYWQEFGDESEYHVHIKDSKLLNPLVTTSTGNRVVGAIFKSKNGGALVALPWVEFNRQEFLTYEDDPDGESTWTPEAMEWGTKYVNALKSVDAAIRSRSRATSIPQWAKDEKFRTRNETELSEELLRTQTDISELERQRDKIHERLESAGYLKPLLFEQGSALETAILEAMRLMGFSASGYRESDSEFDAVLECPEGRCIGEAEGRDNKPISIHKMRQLEVNIHEDFARDEVSNPAKGILFGNANRLTPPPDRSNEHFTPKCLTAAQRNGSALIRTCDLFEVARALADNPDDEFATLCRQAIFDASGEIVKFPAVPAMETGKRSKKVQEKKSE